MDGKCFIIWWNYISLFCLWTIFAQLELHDVIKLYIYIDINGMSIHLGLFYAKKLGNHLHLSLNFFV